MPRKGTASPFVVRQNTLLLVASQAVYSCVLQAELILVALVVFTLTGSAALSGLATAVTWGTRVLVVYQTGRLMDQIGRKSVLLIGIGLGSLALFLMGWAVVLSLIELFWIGLPVFGIGSGIIQQSRVAVMDMYPIERRGEGMGYLMTANTVGSFASPVFTATMIPLATFASLDQYAVILLASSLLLALSSVFIIKITPDTKEIAKNLKSYYPDAIINEFADDQATAQGGSLFKSIRFFPILAAFVASAFAWGDMIMMMSLVSIVMYQHEVILTLISLALTLHFFGMYGLSVPLGWLCDRMGRRPVVMLGGLILGIGAFLTPLTSGYAIITLGIFLVGLGWSAANVATSALISDLTPAERRGRILGANDVSIGLAALSLPAIGGFVMSTLGLVFFGVTGLLSALPTLLIFLPLQEIKPGKYIQ